ncbi:protein PHLOEM PROTEIN 2-LIKE A1-like [Papaver somniferum]|uniref:protein PHLOEM PROTEIN 2-LIKE A1-like n=1 Tax=Papaver somniferum TaxID=3469 RepID=UPI000E6FFFE0|nr:protein PHLOEM PROTEIN 2-LIKE A1-like [Papaver somniferum]
MLFPRSFGITWEHDTRYWTWLSITEPSASGDEEIEVPELVKVCWLTIHGKLVISRLSPGVNYEVVFIVMLQEDGYGWEVPVDLCLVLPDGKRLIQKVNLETMPKSQWIEIHVGDFKTPHQLGDQEKEVNFIMSEHEKLNWKKGLVIEEVIIRPKK